jgi:nickel transport protein
MSRLLLCCLIVCLFPLFVSAHAIGVQATRVGDRIKVEAFYDDDTPTEQAKVTVLSQDGQTIASGLTDERGLWYFPVPSSGNYSIRVDAGDGHRATINLNLTLEEITTPQESRAEATRWKWERTLIGVAVISVATILLWFARGRRHSKAVS